MINDGAWRKLTPGFRLGEDERLVLLTDENLRRGLCRMIVKSY